MRIALFLLSAVVTAASACRDTGVVPVRGGLADSADQVMDSMRYDIVRNGVRTSRVDADSAWIYQARQVADLVGMQVVFYDSTGRQTSTVKSDSGRYHFRDGTLHAFGNVEVTTANGSRLNTQHLVYDRTINQISSDSAYTFTSPDGNGSGENFVTDTDFRQVITHRPRGRQRGQGFVIPGQSRDP